MIVRACVVLSLGIALAACTSNSQLNNDQLSQDQVVPPVSGFVLSAR
jgi:hypothetical protein